MALQSMTGYAHQEDTYETLRWTWEMRSVNGRGLDARIRMPAGFERLEQTVRDKLASVFSRGNVQVTLNVTREERRVDARVNSEVLDAVLALADELRERTDAEPARIDGLLNIRGVLEFHEPLPDEEVAQGEQSAVLASLDTAISALHTMRLAEGERIGKIVAEQIDRFETLARQVEADPSLEPEAIRQRLKSQVQALLETGAELDEDRLHMEAAILAAKADIREEIDRILAHVEASRALLGGGGVVGRRLDFLAQEFNRESNTICSKSNASSVTAIGLELKVLIDQFREQIQNLE